jgi:hypothetical protein
MSAYEPTVSVGLANGASPTRQYSRAESPGSPDSRDRAPPCWAAGRRPQPCARFLRLARRGCPERLAGWGAALLSQCASVISSNS